MSRLTSEANKQPFGDETHYFYVEKVCNEEAIDETHLCRKCSQKSDATRTQASRQFDHGFIGGEYTEKSHIYDSPWYHDHVALWGEPRPEIVQYAKQFQENALIYAGNLNKFGESNVQLEMAPRKKVEGVDSGAEVGKDGETPVVKPKVVRRKKKMENIESAETGTEGGVENTVLPSTSTPAPEKKRRAVRIPKAEKSPKTAKTTTQKCANRVEIPQMETAIIANVIEETTEVLPVEDVMIIRVRSFEHNGRQYFREPNKNKLYEKKTGNVVGEYIGRWNSISETICHDIPDSDAE